jgi:hypothetical protein
MRDTRKKIWPRKYYTGLSRTTQKKRRAEIQKFGAMDWKDPRAYVGFKTDVGVQTKPSSYTQEWNRRFPDAKSLEERSTVTGIPVRYLRKSYNRGLAAWRTGHRPGATPQQWGYARASSFSLCGKTAITTDSDLRRDAIRRSMKAKRWFASVDCLEPK